MVKMLNNHCALNEALIMAINAHSNQMDKGNNPYILHPLRLMMQLENIDLKIIALLHDVVEDSDITILDLHNKGFRTEVIQAVEALTKKNNEDYDTFIQRVSENKLALPIKILDIQDNLDITRLSTLTDKDFSRLAKYHKALHFLNKCVKD